MSPSLARRTVPDAPEDIVVILSTDINHTSIAEQVALLGPEEIARADAFRFAKHRGLFVHAHAVQRRALSQLVPDVLPAEWQFHRPEPNGKPFAVAPNGAIGPKFSLTHCEGLIGIALSTRREIGLDAEQTGRKELSLDLARNSFAPVEAHALASLPHPGPTLARLWCGKEALSKAVGLGLAMDFAALVIDPQNAAIEQTPPPLRAEDWAFTYPEASASHTLALAWRRG